MASRGALLNYSTTVEASRSIEQIQKRLQIHGASTILLKYSDGEVVAISFQVRTEHGELGFRLPANVAAVYKLLMKQRSEGKISRRVTPLQAHRIAWRILKDWVEAQLALVQVGMAATEQVFLPYYIDQQTGKTVYQHMLEGGFGFKAIGTGQEEK